MTGVAWPPEVIWCRQLVPHATTVVPGGSASICSTSGCATRTDSSYLDLNAPNAPAIPQHPVFISSAEVPGSRLSSRACTP